VRTSKLCHSSRWRDWMCLHAASDPLCFSARRLSLAADTSIVFLQPCLRGKTCRFCIAARAMVHGEHAQHRALAPSDSAQNHDRCSA